MESEENNIIEKAEEYPDSWWYRVYLAVIIFAVVIITALGFFTKFFS